MKIKLVLFKEGQENIICNIHNSSFKYFIDNLGIRYGYKNIVKNEVKKWFDAQNSKIVIAYYDNKPVGYTHITLEEIQEKDNIKNKIRNIVFQETMESLGQSKICVLPKYRNKGIAKELISYVLNHSSNNDAQTALILTYNDNNQINSILEKLKFKHRELFYLDSFSKTKPFVNDSVLAVFDFTKKKLPNIRLNEKIITREIQEEDLEDMREVFGSAQPNLFGEYPSIEKIREWYESNWSIKKVVAKLDGKVIGCMEYTEHGRIGIPGVSSKYQKKGIGSTLLYNLLLDMKNNGLSLAIADSGFIMRDVIKLYKKLNFDTTRKQLSWVYVI